MPAGHTAWSVVIPCRDGERTLGRQLEALSRQTLGQEFEVVVVDNGSSDRSAEVALSWQGRLPLLNVVPASPAGINVARNSGVRASRGELVALCDADDEAHPDWLRGLARALEGDADLAGGAIDWAGLNPEFTGERRRLQSELADHLGFLPWPEGANFAFKRAVWEHLGGFDEAYRGGGDEVEFAWRAQLAGYRLVAAPEAVMRYAARPGARSTFKQSLGYGRSHAQLYKNFREAGMRRPSGRTVLGRWWWIAGHAHKALRPGEGREAFVRRSGISTGRILGSIQYRTLFL